jgi:hypothetical protein
MGFAGYPEASTNGMNSRVRYFALRQSSLWTKPHE